METKTYNIWKLFYFILVISLLILSVILYNVFNIIHTQHNEKLITNVQLIAKSINSSLSEKSILLDLVAKNILNMKDKKNQIAYLDASLKKYPSLAAFGLIKPDGEFIVASSNIQYMKKPNLLQSKSTKYYFNKALHSKNLVIGKTRYFAPLGKWIIPLRKTIYDEDGKAVAVMTTGFLNELDKDFLGDLKVSDDEIIELASDANEDDEFYIMYNSQLTKNTRKKFYNEPVPEFFVKELKSLIVDNYNFTLEDMRTNNGVIVFTLKGRQENKSVFSMLYNKKYKIWVIILEKYKLILDEFLEKALIYSIFFLIIMGVLYFIFRKIYLAEKARINELVYLSEHDALTALPNRTYLYKHIQQWKEKHNNAFDVIFIDLDNFKNINDNYGHQMGDKILLEVAKRLNDFCSNEMIVRQGGDEFIIISQHQNKEELTHKVTHLISEISEVYYIGIKEFRIGLSVGSASCPKDAENLEELLSLADTALYKAKIFKNSYVMFSESMKAESSRKSDIEQELRRGLVDKEFWLVYQPQIGMDGVMHGVEALVRWENEKLGFVGPDVFISVAEESGIINELGDFITRTALQEINDIYNRSGLRFSLSINVSVNQFIEKDYLINLLKIIEEEQFDKSLLTLEITESLSIEDLDEILPLLNAIHDEGIEVSLDDFGTGYSSLSILKALPIHELKIDKSFIDTIIYNEVDKSLVNSMIDIGKNFGMKVLAEGVESMEQVKILQELECDIIQGYYFSKPLKIEQLEQYLQKESNDIKVFQFQI